MVMLGNTKKKTAYFMNSNDKRGMKSSCPTIPFKVTTLGDPGIYH